MLFLPWSRARLARGALIACGLTAYGCAQEPLPDRAYDRQALSGEVFRVFCLRTARTAYPNDVAGDRFYPLCDGEVEPTEDDDPRLSALISRREEIVGALQQVFAEDAQPEREPFAEDEISEFMRALVELYDPPNEVVPKATRGIAEVLGRLLDEGDPRAQAVIDTVARLSARTGYRRPDRVLGALRPVLGYERLDTLAKLLLKEVAAGGGAHEAFVRVLEAAALELADEPVAVADRDESTLRKALALLFASDDALAGESGPALVLARDDQGNARAIGGDPSVTPFPVLGRVDTAEERDAESALALTDGEPSYETFDANKTVLAAVMRETSALIAPGEDGDRSPLEYVAHGLAPLLGPTREGRSKQIGGATYSFTGPAVEESPLLDLLHALAVVARYPETESLLKLLGQLLEGHESEATALLYAGLRIDEFSDEYEDAKLTGWDGNPGSPHELWDDLIAVAQRMTKRPGLFEGLIKSFADPHSGMQGKLYANWMRFKDEVSYPNSPSTDFDDINGEVAHAYSEEAPRSGNDVGMNRSVWQRTMSLIHALNGVKICNKDKAVLTVQTDALGTLTFPGGYPLLSDGYKACELIEVPDAMEIYSRAVIGKGTIQIKDAFATLLAGLGEALGITGNVGQIQEKSAQITGFTDKPTPQSLARFLFAPRNKFLTDLFEPTLTRDSEQIVLYEPNALFPVENRDASVLLDGEPQSFITAGGPMIAAFDAAELRDPLTGQLTDGYMFGHLLSTLHLHWSSPKSEPCPSPIASGDEGCTQRLDPKGKLYAPQTNLVSYEELIARSFDEEDFVGHLHRAAKVLVPLSVDGKTGDKILGEFLQRMVTPDPALSKRNGDKFSKTNTCELVGTGASASCKDGRGRVIETLSPIYLVLDALKRFDETFADDEERHEAWLTGRSRLVDQLLTVDNTGDDFALRDRNAYAIALAALPWASEQIAAHREAGDLEQWSNDLSKRLATVLEHPLTAAVIELLDRFWDAPEAAREFDAVASYVLDEVNNPEAFQGMLIAAADMLTLLDRDPELSPAIQFAALALAPNAFDAVDGNGEPDARSSALFQGLELAKSVVERDEKQPSTLSKLLKNLVTTDAESRSPLEVLIDATADVNRTALDAPPEQPLSAEEDRHAFGQVHGFLTDQESGLERLYQVIQGRKVAE